MNTTITIILVAVVALLIGFGCGFALFRYVIKKAYNQKMKEAELEASNLKEKKLLEVKEKFLNKKEYLQK